MKTIKQAIVGIFVICIVCALSACSVITPYLDKAAEMSVETSTKTLEASVYYLCDRSRSGDLMRRYPNAEELKRHFQWCLDQQRAKQSVAPGDVNE